VIALCNKLSFSDVMMIVDSDVRNSLLTLLTLLATTHIINMYLKLQTIKLSVKRSKALKFIIIPAILLASWYFGLFLRLALLNISSSNYHMEDSKPFAYVTLLTNFTNQPDDVQACMALGNSIRAKTNDSMVLLYTEQSLTKDQLCMLKQVGWVSNGNSSLSEKCQESLHNT
jgi:hypothetical protein